MISVKLLLCAERVIRDAESNSITVVNLLEDFASPGFPLFIQNMCLFALTERQEDDAQDHQFLFKIHLNDNELVSLEVQSKFGDKLRHRNIINVSGFVIPNPGQLKLSLFHEDKEVAEYLMQVKKIGPPEIKSISDEAGKPNKASLTNNHNH